MDFARKDTPVDRMIRDITFAEDGITTTATATLDNGFVVVGTHSFERAKHFVLMEGRAGAVDAVRGLVAELLHFRELDDAHRGHVVSFDRDPWSRTRAEDYARQDGPAPVEPQPEDDTLHIRITDAAGNSTELAFDPTPDDAGVSVPADFDPDVTPTDAEPGSAG